MIRFPRTSSTALAVAAVLASCGPSADAAPEPPAAEAPATAAPQAAAPRPPAPSPEAGAVLGTIEATVDGQPRIWYVVSAPVRGELYSSAVWYETPDGELVASFGGYDTADLPFDSFEIDPTRSLSLGDYEGSAFTILLMPEGGVEPYSVALSEDAPGLVYAPDAADTFQDVTAVFFGRSGTLNVTRLEIVGDRLAAEGTFEGAVMTMGGAGPVELAEGRFSVEGVPSRDLLPGGG